MKKKSNLVRMFIAIILVGMAVSIFNGDFQIGNPVEHLGSSELEVLFEVLSVGLGFLALAALLVFFIIRANKKD